MRKITLFILVLILVFCHFGITASAIEDLKVSAKSATCTATGNIAHYKCSKCSKLFSDSAGKKAITDVTVKALGHNMKKVAVLLADGFEEIEGLTVVDLLRRAGIEVTTVSITDSKTIHGAHGIDVLADKLFEEVEYENVTYKRLLEDVNNFGTALFDMFIIA